jgi:hypothetical protein
VQVDPGTAIDALTSAISGLLSTPADAALKPRVSVLPAATSLSGLGGFIGYSEAPAAERRARRVEGEVLVRVLAASEAELAAAEARAARDLVAADPVQLRRSGILRLERVVQADGPALVGAGAPAARDLRFTVHFEHAPLPTEPEGTITELRHDTMLAAPGAGKGPDYETQFLTDPLADFVPAAAEIATGTAAAWTYDRGAQELRQTGSLGGGEDGMSGDKTGAYLLLRTAAAPGLHADVLIEAEMRSDGPGGFGLVFNYRNRGSFAFVLLEQPPGHRVMGRRGGGAGALLAEGGRDASAGFKPNQWLRLRLLAQGDRAELAIDETVVLAGRDPMLRAAGQVGLFCRGGASVRIRHFKVSSLAAEGR